MQSFDDLLRALREHPEWRQALRRELLTDELLTLPQLVRELAEAQTRTEARLEALTARVDTLSARVEALTARVEALAEAQERTEARLEALTARVETLAEALQLTVKRLDTLDQKVDAMRGDTLEWRYRAHVGAYFGPLLRRARRLPQAEFMELVEDALDAGQLSEAESDDLLHIDIVVRGRDRQTREELYLLVEVSAGVGLSDVERAARRAGLLARLAPTRAAVAGEWIVPEAEARCRELGVWQVLDGAVIPPDAS